MDEDVVLVERVESSVVSTQKDAVVTVVVTEPTVVTDEMRSYVLAERSDTQVVTDGEQGPAGPQGIQGIQGIQGEPGGAVAGTGDLNYTHSQGTPSDTWVIVHNLSKRPSIVVVDSGNTEVVGTYTYDSINQVTLTFNGSFSGTAHLN